MEGYDFHHNVALYVNIEDMPKFCFTDSLNEQICSTYPISFWYNNLFCRPITLQHSSNSKYMWN